jgi:(R,R)-butanediol dehydrogenase / meso-butanediol dehydrogenase / diacetyl reductase
LTTTLAHICEQDLPEAIAVLSATDVASRTIEKSIGLGDLVGHGIIPLVERTAKGKILVDPWA